MPLYLHHIYTHVNPKFRPVKISTALGLETWKKHPDRYRWFLGFILHGIEHGFRIGFHGEQESFRTRMKNMVSAAEHPAVASTVISMLGLELDTEIRLSLEKLALLKATLENWKGCKVCKKGTVVVDWLPQPCLQSRPHSNFS